MAPQAQASWRPALVAAHSETPGDDDEIHAA